jgi:hypothetical protein
MSSDGEKGLFEKVRAMRDSGLEDLAKVTLAWTSSDAYQAVNAAISKPALLTAAMVRKATEAAMADVLARLNLPSREDVLALSQRLTRIEMALDDLAAGMDQLRRGPGRPQRPVARARGGNGEGRTGARPATKEE